MRSVNTATRNAWNTISYTKIRIYLPDSQTNIGNEYISSIKMKEAISDTENMFFVGCVSTKVDITLNNFSTNLHLKPIEIYAQKGTSTELKIYTGKIYTCDVDEKNNTTKIVAYDALYRIFNADVTSWYDGLSFPMTMKAFRDSFFERFSVTQKSATLLNDSMLVENTIGGEQILGRDIIKPICEANVCFGHIDYDGEMTYISISNDTRTVPVAEVSDMNNAKYTTDVISKVIIRESEEDIGVIAGTGSNAYIIQGNMFFLGIGQADLQNIANAILSAIGNISFIPAQSTQQYNAVYELGDKILVPDQSGNTYSSFILERETDFQREKTKAKGLKDYSQAASYSNVDLISLYGMSNKLYRDITETRSTITNVAEGLQTEITQTAEGLEIQIADLQAQIDGETAYYERESGAPTLLNYPYWDFTTSIPCNNTIRLDQIYTDEMQTGGNKYPHFYYSEMDRKNHRSDLCFVDDTNLAYRFVLENGVWYWKEIADSEYTQILSRLSTLEATSEELTSEYEEIKIDLRDNYWGISETQSAISQTASEITTSVSQNYQTIGGMSDYYTKSQTNTQISQTASDITSSVSSTYQTLSGMSDYYNKATADGKYQPQSAMSNYYTKAQTNSQINQKATEITSSVSANYQTISGMSDYQTVSGMSNYYNKATSDGKYQTQSAMSNYYTKALSDDKYQTQSGMSNYYNKTDSNNRFQTQSAMSNYYTKTQVYTKTEIQQRESNVKISVKDDIAVDYYNKNQTNSKFQTQEDMDNYFDKTESDARYYYSSDAELLVGRVEDIEGDNVTIHSEISAKVSETYGNNQSAFSWVLRSSGFDIKNSGTSVFKVNSGGAQITGKITATSGAIGGWSISNNSLACNNVTIQGDGSLVCKVGNTVKWALTNDGALSATNASIQGNINASTGTIGGWSISSGSLVSNTVSLQGDGSLVCRIGGQIRWALSSDGTLTATNATLSGYSKSSEIAANYATIAQLDGVNARFDNINANNITTGTISTDRLNINGLIASFRGKAVVCSGVSADYAYFGNLYQFVNGTQYGFYKKQTTINGTTIYYWGW